MLIGFIGSLRFLTSIDDEGDVKAFIGLVGVDLFIGVHSCACVFYEYIHVLL